uniref:Wiskott-Aldrich syndrome protein n=1 Tax=Toxocara canis TaxID=6265 RepID=A0A183UY92_TOXCA
LQTLATGVAQLLYGDTSKCEWETIATGVICYVRDYNKREVSVQLVDPGYPRPSMGVWKLVVSSNVAFIKKHPNLVTFEADDETLYGLNFSLSSEAEKFFFSVQNQQIGLFTDLSTRMDNAFTSIKRSVPKRKKSESMKKKKKLDKLDIGLPTDFVHKAHCGDNPFMDDSEMDKTVREIYAFLQIDINEADKQEIDMIRRQVTVHGADKLRLSMKRPRTQQRPTVLNNDRNGVDNSNITATGVIGLKDARDSLRLTPRDQGRITPTSVKHFNEVKRGEIERRSMNATSVAQDRLEMEAKNSHEWSMRTPKTEPFIPNPPHPPPPSIYGRSEPRAHSPPPLKTRSYSMTEQTVALKKEHPRLEQNKHKPVGRNAPNYSKSLQDTADRLAGSYEAPQPTPPPPPPPPPPSTLSSSAKSNNTAPNGTTSSNASISQGRQNLLEAIRNADKSALRKVSRKETAENEELSSALSQESGSNLMDAIGRMIEQRRKRINNSSDEEDENELDDEEEWSD